MTGTPEQITAKKAARIRSNVRQFSGIIGINWKQRNRNG